MKRRVDGEEVELSVEPVEIVELSDRWAVRTPEGVFTAVAVRRGDAIMVSFRGRQFRIEPSAAGRSGTAAAESGEIRAPMPGSIAAVKVSVGQSVKKGDTVVVLEAMKTQQPFLAPFDGIVENLPINTGHQVSEGDLLAFIKGPANNPNCVGE